MKKLVKRYIWSIVLCGVEIWILGKVDQNHVDVVLNVVLEKGQKYNWTVWVKNMEVNNDRNILHTVERRKDKRIGHFMRKNGAFLKHVIRGN